MQVPSLNQEDPLEKEMAAHPSILTCLGWSFSMLEVCAFSLLWRLLPVGGAELVACQGLLVREACVSVLVGGAGSLLSGVQ